MSRSVTSFSKMRIIVPAIAAFVFVSSAHAEDNMECRVSHSAMSGVRNTDLLTDLHSELSGTGDIGHALHLSLTQPEALAMAGDEFDTAVKGTTPTSGSKNKSLIKAGLYSALLPGLGQRYVGSSTKTKVFLGVEIGIWLGYASYKVYEGWKEDDMIRFAAEHANAQLENTSDDFRDLVGFYDDIDQYNMVARATDFGTRPYLMDTPENHWRWQSSNDQGSYRQFKNSWREAGRRAEIMLVMTVVNRLVSIIDAVRDARKSNRRLDTEFSKEEKPSVHLAIDPLSRNNQVKVAVTGLF